MGIGVGGDMLGICTSTGGGGGACVMMTCGEG